MNRSNHLWRLLSVALALPLLSAASCPPDESAGWLLANRRDHLLTLTLRRTEQCERGRRVPTPGAADDDLSEEDSFGPAERVVVRAQDKIWLVAGQRHDGLTQQRCGAIWISAEGEFDLVLAWDALPSWDGDVDTTPYSVIVEGPKNALVLYVPDEIEQLPPPEARQPGTPAP